MRSVRLFVAAPLLLVAVCVVLVRLPVEAVSDLLGYTARRIADAAGRTVGR